MTAVVSFTAEHLTVAFPGAEVLLTLQRSITLPWAEVVGASVQPQAEAKRTLGWRVGGGYFPGWFATGHFTTRGQRGERQLWCAYRAREVLVIETTRPRPRRIVVQVDDPHALARAIDDRVRHPVA